MNSQKISIPWQDYCRIILSILMVILGPILVYRSLSVPAYTGVVLGMTFLGYGCYRLWLVYRVLGKKSKMN